ncbi:hypothetical protein FB45DRAFT_1007594 [Roridomyces roridus]|uniref:Uncharacterized protein n=1 Tax=Roridomyces roridus TaxID=1738132 RepID=A0AAD7BDU6_9AGAR|nr:hypothetical protein FB45DRAFT_1007594 [Roridomyces roridus]
MQLFNIRVLVALTVTVLCVQGAVLERQIVVCDCCGCACNPNGCGIGPVSLLPKAGPQERPSAVERVEFSPVEEIYSGADTMMNAFERHGLSTRNQGYTFEDSVSRNSFVVEWYVLARAAVTVDGALEGRGLGKYGNRENGENTEVELHFGQWQGGWVLGFPQLFFLPPFIPFSLEPRVEMSGDSIRPIQLNNGISIDFAARRNTPASSYNETLLCIESGISESRTLTEFVNELVQIWSRVRNSNSEGGSAAYLEVEGRYTIRRPSSSDVVQTPHHFDSVASLPRPASVGDPAGAGPPQHLLPAAVDEWPPSGSAIVRAVEYSEAGC